MEKEEGGRAMSIECETCADRNCTCGDCGAKQIVLPVADYEQLRIYIVSLEASRRDLMGSNEELYEKIGALERGQEDLQRKLDFYREILRASQRRPSHLKRFFKFVAGRRSRTDP